MRTRSPSSSITVALLTILLVLLGIGAVISGGLLMAAPDGRLMGMPLSMLKHSPFASFFIPGAILLTFLGIYPLILTYGLVRRPEWRWANALNPFKGLHWSWVGSAVAGAIVIIWIVVEVLMLWDIAFLHVFYLVWGLALIALTLLPPVRRHCSLRNLTRHNEPSSRRPGTVPGRDLEEHFAAIQAAANRLLASVGPSLTNTPDDHIETDIAGAAATAGARLLRAHVRGLDRYKPGEIVLSDIHDAQGEVFGFMGGTARSLELDYATGWDTPIPPEHAPILETPELVRRLEPSLLAACAEVGLPDEYCSYIAALAAVKLVSAGDALKLLDPNIGKGLALYYLVAGTKTVPHPLPPR